MMRVMRRTMMNPRIWVFSHGPPESLVDLRLACGPMPVWWRLDASNTLKTLQKHGDPRKDWEMLVNGGIKPTHASWANKDMDCTNNRSSSVQECVFGPTSWWLVDQFMVVTAARKQFFFRKCSIHHCFRIGFAICLHLFGDLDLSKFHPFRSPPSEPTHASPSIPPGIQSASTTILSIKSSSTYKHPTWWFKPRILSWCSLQFEVG